MTERNDIFFYTKGLGLKNVRELLAILLSGFAIYTAAFGVQPDFIQTSVHLSLALILVFTLSAKGSPSFLKVSCDWVLATLAFITIGYHFIFYNEVAAREGVLTNTELWLGIGAIALLLEGTRRIMGWPLVILALIFILYTFSGPYLPGLFEHRGYDVERVISQIYLGADGIFGTPLFVSATFVILIVIFGALLEISGASGVLMDIAVSMTRNSRGGPPKAAVVGSSLMGMISGTAVANVLTTGTISIPLMRRGGYRPAVAGAVEAVASTGGQLMPPIMGAAAFLMADIMEVPYLDITKAALLPALLFYIAVFASVHLEAVKTGLKPLESIDIPDVAQSLRNSGHVLLSIPVFIGTLISGYSVMYSSLAGIVCLLALSLLRYSSRLNPRQLIAAAVSAAEAILPVALATATAGIIIGVVTLTGMGLKFSSFIVSISGNNLLVALVLTMASSLVLGMGLPTAAAYILVATLTAPALVSMGVDLMAAHMFVFYSAMLSSITPPVALAAFAAAAICREPPMRVAMISVKFGFVAFLLPYFFVLEPRLLGMGDIGETVGVFAMAVVGVLSLACVLQGYAFGKLTTLSRIFIGIAALAVLMPDLKFKLIGIAAILAVLVAWKIGQFTKSNQN